LIVLQTWVQARGFRAQFYIFILHKTDYATQTLAEWDFETKTCGDMHCLATVKQSRKTRSEVNQRIGEALGSALLRILTQSKIHRAVISGGDTSGFATCQLGIFALSALAPTIPGASLFKAHAQDAMDGLELALKGGQMGSPAYFG
jgi:uncharacterized protein YgbK (DUF1537 family)